MKNYFYMPKILGVKNPVGCPPSVDHLERLVPAIYLCRAIILLNVEKITVWRYHTRTGG